MSGFNNVKGFFIKALDAKGDLDLLSFCTSLVSIYSNVVESSIVSMYKI